MRNTITLVLDGNWNCLASHWQRIAILPNSSSASARTGISLSTLVWTTKFTSASRAQQQQQQQQQISICTNSSRTKNYMTMAFAHSVSTPCVWECVGFCLWRVHAIWFLCSYPVICRFSVSISISDGHKNKNVQDHDYRTACSRVA